MSEGERGRERGRREEGGRGERGGGKSGHDYKDMTNSFVSVTPTSALE